MSREDEKEAQGRTVCSRASQGTNETQGQGETIYGGLSKAGHASEAG